MSESVRMVVVLALIAMVSGGVLSLVYGPTSAKIEENAARALESSVFEVLPGIDRVNIIRRGADELRVDDPSEMREQEQRTTLIYQGVDKAGTALGYAFVGEGNGYGGAIRILVGVDQTSGEIVGVKVLDHTETPGLGSRIEEEGFRRQFVGKTTEDPLVIGEDLDVISGATVSSKAAAEAIRRSFAESAAIYKGGE